MNIIMFYYFLQTLLLLVFEAATVSPRRPVTTCAHTSNTNGKCLLVNTAAFALDSNNKRKYIRSIRPSRSNSGIHISEFVVAAAARTGTTSHDDDGSNISDKTRSRQMVMFRAPSRHTYGFVRNNAKNNNYDLPAIELRTLLSSMMMNETHNNDDIQFLPLFLENNSSQQLSENNSIKQSPSARRKGNGGDEEEDEELPKLKSKNQSKKKKGGGAAANCYTSPHHPIPLLYWIECAANNNNEISTHDIVAKAARRAILTHATFSINESISFSEDDWRKGAKNTTSNYSSCTTEDSSHVIVGCREILLGNQLDVIDMSNPNLSREDRIQLIETVSYLIEQQNPELKLRLNNMYNNQLHDREHILIHHHHHHHSITPTMQQQQHPQNNERRSSSSSNNKLEEQQQNNSRHCFYFGYRTSIGLAGTLGAPSQTLRRTHRGLLKKYALKNRRRRIGTTSTNDAAYDVTSTAMEPEIGFLMANLALVGIINPAKNKKGCCLSSRRAVILDPCCGSGRLLLYAAALGASTLIGVDSDPTVWKDAESEFQRHVSAVIDCTTTRSSSLAVPKFFQGDVLNPSLTKVLCTPNSVDAIICDPPYNIGAPILVDGGKKDIRPRNYHHHHDNNNNKNNDQRQQRHDDDKSNRSSPERNKGNNINNEMIPTTTTTTDLVVVDDLVPSILAIARKVLVNGGKIIFFIPIRGEEMMLMSIEELLLSRGWYHQLEEKDDNNSLHLLKNSTILQTFSPTFSRWLVCMEKRF